MEKGYYRVHLVAAEDNDWMTIYVPLTQEGRYDPGAPKPHLLKCRWRQEDWLGEFVVEHSPGWRYNKVKWLNTTDVDYLTDFLTAPIKLAGQCYVYEGDSPVSDKFIFHVRSLTRL